MNRTASHRTGTRLGWLSKLLAGHSLPTTASSAAAGRWLAAHDRFRCSEDLARDRSARLRGPIQTNLWGIPEEQQDQQVEPASAAAVDDRGADHGGIEVGYPQEHGGDAPFATAPGADGAEQQVCGYVAEYAVQQRFASLITHPSEVIALLDADDPPKRGVTRPELGQEFGHRRPEPGSPGRSL